MVSAIGIRDESIASDVLDNEIDRDVDYDLKTGTMQGVQVLSFARDDSEPTSA